MGKKCHNGIGINMFERWEAGFGKNMGWGNGIGTPLKTLV